jgi:hypothetical protein
MKSDIAAYYGMDKDAEKVALVGRMIHDMIDDLNMRKLWRFNLIKAADITTVSGTADYAVPADLWRMYSSRKTNDIDFMISGMQQHSFDVMFQSQNQITGYPYVRADFNIFRDGTVKLFPTPDGVHTISLRYFRLILKPSSDADLLDMPSPFQVVPKWGALAQLAAFVGHQTVGYWQAKYEKAYADMNKSDEVLEDEDLRFVSVEEMAGRTGYDQVGRRPRYLDFF